MAENTNQNVNNNGANGANDAQDNQVKKTLRQKVDDALNKEHKFTLGRIVKGVAFIAAIPIAFVVGKTVQKQQDNELLDLTSNPEPAALPDNQNGNEVKTETIDVEYDEVTTD